jgi:ethanolamine utilization protein EutQ
MNKFDRREIESIVRQIIIEDTNSDEFKRTVDKSGVISMKLPLFNTTEENRLNTGDSSHQVYTKDLVSLEESPRMGIGLMVMENTTFNWHLSYDELDYIIEGKLTIVVDGRKIEASAGETIFIPKDTDIQFSVADKARFLYVTYPADWQG